MKTENLTKAYHSFDFFLKELREAHTDAVNSENQFAEAALFSLMEDALKLGTKLTVIRAAAAKADAAKKKGPK